MSHRGNPGPIESSVLSCACAPFNFNLNFKPDEDRNDVGV
jgi:hypothetical protein